MLDPGAYFAEMIHDYLETTERSGLTFLQTADIEAHIQKAVKDWAKIEGRCPECGAYLDPDGFCPSRCNYSPLGAIWRD